MILGTENAITMDANLFCYLINYLDKGTIPATYGITRMADFVQIIDAHQLAVNDFIRTEYNACVHSVFSIRWLKEKHKEGTVEVPPARMPCPERNALRDQYGFDVRDTDMKYLETCSNTIMKMLATHNTLHFCLPRKGKTGPKTMDAYISRRLGIRVGSVDDCCSDLQEVLDARQQTAVALEPPAE